MIRANFVAEKGVNYGDDLDTGYNVVLRKSCSVGQGVKIWSNTVIDEGAIVQNDVRIHCNVYVCQFAFIGKGAFLAPGVVLANDKYPVRTDRELWEPPIIAPGAIIGAGATILPGVRVGECATIGAGSVVTKDVPDGETWYGNPATRQG